MKSVIVTGATSGIGYATSLKFAEDGYQVIGIGRNLDKGPKHNNIRLHKVDLLSEQSVAEFCQNVVACGVTLSGIVHNAGIIIRKPLVDFTLEEVNREFQTHVFSVIQINNAVKNALASDASIVFVNSTLALKPIPNTSVYSAAKAAQASLIQSMAIEWAPVRVNGIHLGIVDTPIHNFDVNSKKVADELQLVGRVATATEVADEIHHLFHSKWSTGAVNVFDGGVLLK